MVTTRPEPRAPRRFNLVRFIANLLIVCGVLLTLFVTALYVYQGVAGYRFDQQARQRIEAFEQERAELEQRRVEIEQGQPEMAQPTASQTPLPAAQPSPLATSTPEPTVAPTATPTPSPQMLRARRMIIPAIQVDSEVFEAEIKDGEWNVPKFVVGHLQGTSNPGTGNSAYSGHLQSISSGNVFARLGELKRGDRIAIQTASADYSYKVDEIKVVANTDLSVLDPSETPIVTLITCTGAWDLVQRDYLQRLIVVATLMPKMVRGEAAP